MSSEYGLLKNGNRGGDLSKVRRCGARTRGGTPCQCPAMRSGRCRLHGGKSTGPRTPEGLERLRKARTKHGRYSAAAKAESQSVRGLLAEARSLLKDIGLSGLGARPGKFRNQG